MQRIQTKEVLPKTGLVYSEQRQLMQTLCKPKILPIKSLTLQQMEEDEKSAT
ncbi:unnamed protein product [Albugo candida]|uniref:Uncharacterized protein n=1 Tax=Albugo candida TaxID=65357 RepID=A0A024GDF0_9STRA|nr:unnamed protein product [Albugo candida]|eukprot:CCI44718.1 unnamed protein product [Albugo candida]